MSPPSTQDLKGVINDILSSARDDGLLSQLTVRIVRQKLATHFHLEEDVLNSGDYKAFIKATVHDTVSRLRGASDEDAELPKRGAVEKDKDKDKAGSTAKTSVRRPRMKGQMHSSDGETEAGHASTCEVPSPKKATGRSKTSKARLLLRPWRTDQTVDKSAKSSKASKKPESDTKYKSKAIIESSDDEAASGSRAQKPIRSPKKEQASKSSPPKQKQHQPMKKRDSDAEMDSVEGPGPSGSKPKDETDSLKMSVSKEEELAKDPMESELSSVVDEPPKKRQKKQERKSTKPESTKPQKDEKAKGGKKEALSKDGETINRLKGIVVACGVRRVWKKEFEGLDKPSQQIKRLHAILGDLGMMPRYSLEKARAIREQRELAQELKDVQEFEEATKRRGNPLCGSPIPGEHTDRGDSDADVPAQKKKNARASIMAFLQDQSEEE